MPSTYLATVSGALGGLAAGFVAQSLVTLAGKLGLGWSAFQSAGPPFFPTALFLGVFYGAIALALSRRWQETTLGLLGPFLGMAVPMALAERYPVGIEIPRGGLNLTDAQLAAAGKHWLHVTLTVYVLAVWGTVAALGWRLGGRWLGMGAAVGGSLAAYGLLSATQWAIPALSQGPWAPTGVLPQASVLLDGLFTGSLLGLSLSISRRHYEKTRSS